MRVDEIVGRGSGWLAVSAGFEGKGSSKSGGFLAEQLSQVVVSFPFLGRWGWDTRNLPSQTSGHPMKNLC